MRVCFCGGAQAHVHVRGQAEQGRTWGSTLHPANAPYVAREYLVGRGRCHLGMLPCCPSRGRVAASPLRRGEARAHVLGGAAWQRRERRGRGGEGEGERETGSAFKAAAPLASLSAT